MVVCLCGALIAAEIGDGWILASNGERMWLRRKSDEYRCQRCRRAYVLRHMKEMALATD